MNCIPPRSYEDIIDLPRPEQHCRPPMPRMNRAAQFAPFAALAGYEEEIDETARMTDVCPDLDEEVLLQLNDELRGIMDCIHTRPEVTLICFEPDEKKAGGAYVSIWGRVRRIDEAGRCILLTDGRKIRMERIVRIVRKGEGEV